MICLQQRFFSFLESFEALPSNKRNKTAECVLFFPLQLLDDLKSNTDREELWIAPLSTDRDSGDQHEAGGDSGYARGDGRNEDVRDQEAAEREAHREEGAEGDYLIPTVAEFFPEMIV